MGKKSVYGLLSKKGHAEMPREHLETFINDFASVEGSGGLYRSCNLERSEITFDFQMINDPSSASRLMEIWNDLEFLNRSKSLREVIPVF